MMLTKRPSPPLLWVLAVLLAATGLFLIGAGRAGRRLQARARARHLVAEALARADQPAAQADLFQKARAADPTYNAAPCQRGAELDRIGHWSEAVESHRACVALDPRQAWAQVRYAESRLKAQGSDSYLEIRTDLQRFLEELADDPISVQDDAARRAARGLIADLEQLLTANDAQDFPERYSVDDLILILLRPHVRGASRYEGPRVPLRLGFHSGDAALSTKAAEQLRDVARALQDGSLAEAPIRIEGYTDSVEGRTRSGRMALARRRAEAVRDFLVHHCGIPAGRLTALARADEELLDSNETEPGRAANRRVELFNLLDRDPVRGDVRR
jgi:outer membrane protein OmpA-like peptidoglycan-associated protein